MDIKLMSGLKDRDDILTKIWQETYPNYKVEFKFLHGVIHPAMQRYAEYYVEKVANDADASDSKLPLCSVMPSDLEFNAALKLLRDLADLQNGLPLETYRKEWEEVMNRTYEFLNVHAP